jgi:hypothetical protein
MKKTIVAAGALAAGALGAPAAGSAFAAASPAWHDRI